MKSKLYILITLFLACALQVKGGTTTKTIGTIGDDNSHQAGFGINYKYTSEEMIYLASEIGTSGYITNIANYVVSSSGTLSGCTLSIYMAETDKSSFTSASDMVVSGMTQVYSSTSYTVGAVSSGWEDIAITPFYYSGKKNLVVAVVTSKPGYQGVPVKTNTKASRRLRKYSDTSTSYGALSSANMVVDNTFPVTRFKIAKESVIANVGTGTTTSSGYGLGDYYRNFASQTLYLSDEIGQSGYIEKFQFAATDRSGSQSGTLSVYMAEVDDNTLTSVLPSSLFTKVYDGSFTFGSVSGGYNTVTLQTPFYYSGTKNLVVALASKKESYIQVVYNSYPNSAKNRSLYTRNDTQGGDYLTPFATGMAQADYLSVTRFSFTTQNSCSNKAIAVGSGSVENYCGGFSPSNSKSASQSLYLKSDIASTGIIKNMQYWVKTTSSSTTTDEVRVYMAEVSQNTLDTKLDINNMTLVFSGNVTVGGQSTGTLHDITLDKPFTYSGIGNLAIAISNTVGSTFSMSYRCTATSDNRFCYTGTSADPNSVKTYASNLPDIRLIFEDHSTCSNYSNSGYGYCDRCKKLITYEFEMPNMLTSVSGGPYRLGVKNVGQMLWLSKGFSKTPADDTKYEVYLLNDIDMSGHTWIPIGNNSYPMYNTKFFGYDESKQGHTIKGISSANYLFGAAKTCNLYSIRLENGRLINKAVSGTMTQCLTLGDALYGSKASAYTIENSYYLASSSNSNGGRTSAQMASGEVTYDLNSYVGDNKTTWYQTIGTDAYPMVASTSGVVYRYTNDCVHAYTNNASLATGEYHAGSLINGVCSSCGAQPVKCYQDVTIDDTKPYVRTVGATMADGVYVKYTRLFVDNNWQEIYLPFSIRCTDWVVQRLDVAEIYAYGVKEDTNHDGNVTSADDKMLIVRPLGLNEVTEPNKPYLIRKKVKNNVRCEFTAVDGILSAAEEKGVTVSTMREELTVKGSYKSQTRSSASGKMLTLGTNNFSSSATSVSVSPFHLSYEISNKNGKAWDVSQLPIYITSIDMPTFIIDDESGASYNRTEEITVNDFTYHRDMINLSGKWQPLYVPFDIPVEMFGDSVDIATIDDVTKQGDTDYIVVTKRTSETISANTPCVLRIHEGYSTLDLKFDEVTLKPAASKSVSFNANHKYTFTGVYEPFQNNEITWYAIAKGDGKFHKAGAGATLPAYRFYMTVDEGETTLSSEFRLGFMEVEEEETSIWNIPDDDSAEFVYSIDGRRVQPETLQPGIYVKGGKKFRVQ